MEFKDPNPSNQEYVREIQERCDFNNLHGHLPGGYKREGLACCKKAGSDVRDLEKNLAPIWKVVDDFIAQTGFDVKAYSDRRRKRDDDRDVALCPLYILLRRAGFSEDRITG